MMPYADIMIR